MDLAEDLRPRLGERIVNAARLAVAVHLFESVQDKLRHHTIGNEPLQRQIGTGGAGPVVAGEAYETRVSF